jgi:hypothetical protein
VPNPRRCEIYKHSELASTLLEQNASVDLWNRNGLTALMTARQQGTQLITCAETY